YRFEQPLRTAAREFIVARSVRRSRAQDKVELCGPRASSGPRRKPNSLTALRGDPVLDAPLENLKRQRAAAEHDVVERANVEPVAERRARTLAKLEDLQH